MATVYLGLGTNIGDKYRNINTAVKLLTERVGEFLILSELYETEPWGFNSENNFLNAVLVLKSKLTPNELLVETEQIEKELGRLEKSNGSYHDRIIDIDLLLVDDVVMNTEQLTLPHPLMHERLFVMRPMVEVAPTLFHPVLNKTMKQLLEDL